MKKKVYFFVLLVVIMLSGLVDARTLERDGEVWLLDDRNKIISKQPTTNFSTIDTSQEPESTSLSTGSLELTSLTSKTPSTSRREVLASLKKLQKRINTWFSTLPPLTLGLDPSLLEDSQDQDKQALEDTERTNSTVRSFTIDFDTDYVREIKNRPRGEFTVKDSQGGIINSSVLLLNSTNNRVQRRHGQNQPLRRGKYFAQLTIEKGPIEEVVFTNLTIDSDTLPLGLENLTDKEFGSSLQQGFAIDPTSLQFQYASIEKTAKGDSLYKCADWNFAQKRCPSEWTYMRDLTPGENYTITLTPLDPAYSENAEGVDVSVFPVNETTFMVAWVDNSESDVSFRYMQVNGSILVNTTDVDTSADTVSRVSISPINSTDFVISWVDGPDNDVSRQLYRINGTNISAASDIDTEVGENTALSVAQLGDRYVICYADQDANSASFQIFNNSGAQLVAETAVDADLSPEGTLRNHVSCAAFNSTRWVYLWYDDGDNHITYTLLNETGGNLTGQVDMDTDVGEIAHARVATLDGDKFAMIWYDLTDEDVTIAVRYVNESVILAPTDIDTAAGTSEVRLAIAPVREDENATKDSFVVAWFDRDGLDIKAAVYNGSGTEVTAPYTVEAHNDGLNLLDIAAKELITGNTICPGKFVLAYNNDTNIGVFKSFLVNGSEWDGNCTTAPDFIPQNLNFSDTNPNDQQNVTINSTIFNNGSRSVNNVLVKFFDGSCSSGTQINGNLSINMPGKTNVTVNVTWIATPIGPHTVSVCVDPDNSVSERNETNNNLNVTLHVKSYNDFYGDVDGAITLDDATNDTQYDWNNTSAGTMYFVDADNTIDFLSLQALGRNTTGSPTANDFSDADTVLNMSAFNDSIQAIWAVNASSAKQVLSRELFGTTINNIPYINSTNNSNFFTAILWDTTKDTNGEFDTAEKEDLVFIGNINPNKTGAYGTYDYEVHVPVNLANYNISTSQVAVYVEYR